MRPRWTRSPEQTPAPDPGATQQPRVPRESGAWRVERAIAGFRRSSDRSDQVPPRSRGLQPVLPVSESELEQVVHEYRHAHEEHRHAHALSPARRHLELTMRDIRRKFERLLAEAPLSDTEQRRWRDRLRGKLPTSPADAGVRPLLFSGRSDAGSELRLIATPEGTVDAFVDGVAAAVLDEAAELTGTAPGFVFALDDVRFRETFGASPRCLADLRDAVATSRRPRRRHLRALMEDGLVDRNLGLTARGRRALALDRMPARHADVGAKPSISIRGPIPARSRTNLEWALARVARVAPQPVLRITASLIRNEDPALVRPVVAKATLDVNGRAVRAHAAAASENEAVSLLESRLHRNLRALADREIAERHEGRAPELGEWRHADIPSQRPAYFSRPAAERRLVRRKSYASSPTTPEAAAAEMLLLDHDFHVFTDEASGEDALVHMRPDGVLALRRPNGSGSYVQPFVLDEEPVPTVGVDDAIELLNLSDDPFVFFTDPSSGRGAVLYHRYDGHYGLVSPET